MTLDPKITGKNFGNKIKNNSNSTQSTLQQLYDGVDSSDMSKYMQVVNTGVDILGDLFYDTNDYAQNFNYQPIQPGIGNRDAILNNNIRYEYQPMQDVGAGEWIGDTLSNGLSVGLQTGNIWAGLGAAAATLIGKGVKQSNINQENNLGYALVDSANKQQNAINNYALEQTDKYNTFMRMRHMAEGGGNLNTHGATFDNGMTYFNVGGTHEQNPYGGILQGFNEEDGEPNLVEQGETKWNDYIFSNRYKAGGSLLKKYLLPEDYAGMTFADISKKLSEPLEDTPGSMIEKRTTDTMLGRLMEAQEEKRAKDVENQVVKEFKKGGHMFLQGGEDDYALLDEPYNVTYDEVNNWLEGSEQKNNNFNFNPRYLTLFDNFASVLGDKLGITNQPDYGRSRMIRDASTNIQNISSQPTYLQEYIPKELPIAALTNAYRSQYAGNDARMIDAVNGNVSLARALQINNENKRQQALGDLALNLMQYNNQEMSRAAELNNKSRLERAELMDRISMFNAQQGNQRYSALRDYINDLSIQDQLASAAQQGNLNTLREGLQNYLMESEDKDVIAQLIKSGALKYDRNAGAYYLDRYLG